MNTSPIASEEICWNCEGDRFIDGLDDEGDAALVCQDCHEVQW